MAIGDVWTVTVNATFLGQKNQNSLSFRVKTAPDITQAQLAAVANDIKELLRPGQIAGYVYTTYKAVQQRGGSVDWPNGECKKVGGLGYEGNLSAPLGGGSLAAAALPPQCALVTTLKSDFIGRTHRGRLYMGGTCEEDQTNGVYGGTFLTGQEARWTTFASEYMTPAGTDANFELGIWSFRTASGCEYQPGQGLVHVDPASPETAFTFVTATLVRPTVYTQRRRVVGVGQ